MYCFQSATAYHSYLLPTSVVYIDYMYLNQFVNPKAKQGWSIREGYSDPLPTSYGVWEVL